MNKYEYNTTNPLVSYYRKLSITNVGKKLNNWNEVSKKSGIHVQTLIKIARMDKKTILGINLGTYLALKTKLGVDMLK